MAKKDIVTALLDLHPRTHAEEAGIRVENRPSALFRVLCAALLASARISSDLAIAATRALGEAGWTTPDKLAAASWAERAKVLNEAGYARYDERTSTMLADTADLLLDRYDGDLRGLRERAGRDPGKERKLVQEFKGIGETGADIFCREIQGLWPELYPHAEDRALKAAANLDLAEDADGLARLSDVEQFPRLVAALVRVENDDDYDRVRV